MQMPPVVISVSPLTLLLGDPSFTSPFPFSGTFIWWKENNLTALSVLQENTSFARLQTLGSHIKKISDTSKLDIFFLLTILHPFLVNLLCTKKYGSLSPRGKGLMSTLYSLLTNSPTPNKWPHMLKLEQDCEWQYSLEKWNMICNLCKCTCSLSVRKKMLTRWY